MRKKDNRRAVIVRMGGLKKLTAVVIVFMMAVSCVAPYGFANVSQDSQTAAQTENSQDVQPAANEEQQEEQSVPTDQEEAVQDNEAGAEEPKADTGSKPEGKEESEPAAKDKTAGSEDSQKEKASSSEEKSTEKEEYPAKNFTGSTSDLDVRVEAPKGAFPEGTVMNTSAVSSGDVIDAAQSLTDKKSEVVGAAAADITFSCNGEEQQPKKPVRVKLTAKNAVKGEEHEAITVSDSGHASAMSGASSRAGSFNTDHFTVYAIIGIDGENYDDEDNEQFIRNTYEFYNGAPDEDYSAYTKIKEVIVRDGDTLAAPNDPAGSSKKIFKGWFVADEDGNITDEQVKDGQKAVVSPATKKEAEDVGKSAEDKTIKVYAVYANKHTVTYYVDEEKTSVFETVVKTEGEDETLITIDDAKARGLRVPEGMYMTGWKEAGTGDRAVLSSINKIDRSWELVPVFTMGHRIVFDTRRPEIFIADQLVPDGKKVVFPELLAIGSEYMGYKFLGWYENVVTEEGKDDDFRAAKKFDFDRALTKDDKDEIRLCAKWEPSQTKYTVQVCQENAHRHQAAFSVHESIEKTGLSEEKVPVKDIIDSYPKDKYEWFHRSGEGKLDGKNEPCFIEVVNKDSTVIFDVNGECKEGNEEDAVISPDGSTIVKVNYCRDSYKINYMFSNIGGDLVPDGSKQYEYDNKGNKTTANTQIGERWLKKNNYDYKDVTLPVITAKYGEWLNECAYANPANAALFDQLHNDSRFMFDRRDFNGKDYSPGPAETVFNETNKETPVKPYTKEIKDGGNLYVFVYLTKDKKEYKFVSDYYDQGVTAADIISGKAKPVNSTTSPGIKYVATSGAGYGHGHQWGIGDVSNGYTLIAVTNYKAVKKDGKIETDQIVLDNGRYTFYWKNGGKDDGLIGKNEYIHIHYVPNPYTITFRQTRNGLVNGFGIDKNDVVSEKKISVYAGEPLTGDDSVLKGENAVPSGGKWEDLSDENGLAYASGSDEWVSSSGDKFLPDKMPGRNLVFYKKWTPQSVEVIFHPENNEENTKQEYRISKTTKVNRIDNPKHTGLVFDGWYLDNEFKNSFDFGTVLNAENVDKLINAGKSKQNSDSDNVKVIHLYAKWDATEPFKVAYDANGGSYSADLEKELLKGKDTADYAVNAKASVKGVAEPSEEMKNDGYVFVGWELGSAGSGKLLKDGTAFSVNDVNDKLDGKNDNIITLVAKYEKNDSSAKLIYHSNYPGGGSDQTKEFTLNAVNEAFEVESPDAETIGFTANGKYKAPDGNTYRFLGWTANTNAPQLGMEKTQYEYFQPGEKAAAGDPQNDKKKGDNELWAVWELIEEEPEAPNSPEKPDVPGIVTDVPDTPKAEDPAKDEPVKKTVKEETTTDDVKHPNAPGKKGAKKNAVTKSSDRKAADKSADNKSGSVRMAGASGAPATGDDTQLMLCLMLMVLSVAAVTAALVVRRKVKE